MGYAALLFQVVVPLGLLGLLTLRVPRDGIRLGLDASFAGLYLVAIALAGLWLAMPRWLVFVYAVLLAVAVLRSVELLGREAESGRRRLPWIRALAVGCAGAVVLAALAGRRPLPGPSVELAFPMAGGPYRVAAGGSTSLLNPHLGTLEGDRFRPWRGQSYAVDVVGAGAWGSRVSPTLAPDLEDFVIFGVDLHAPCDGRVVRAADGQPDVLLPGEAPASLEGNHVILECDGVWVVLAHMARGSVAVETGDPVAVGDVLGRAGNSGSSDEPHLHIHAQTPGTATEPLSGSPLAVSFDGRQPVRNDLIRR